MTKPGLIVQLVPPGQGGVRDYMECLAQQWSRAGVGCESIVLSSEAARQRALHARLAECLCAEPANVVLHFSGYGYGQRGVCFWLLDELAAARAVHRDRFRLTVVFHELFAAGPPWRSAFWLSPLQALIAGRLARMADLVWTNTHHHARWLRGIVGRDAQVHVRPVFSNIGEPGPELVPGPAQRRPQVVVFGSPSTRRRAFDALRGREALLRRMGIEELVEVGSGDALGGMPVGIACRRAGPLQRQALCRLLQESRFGLLDYPSIHLGKSGVFAAYVAHGCVALNTAARGPDADGLVHAQHYLTLGAAAGSSEAQRVAAAARQWYAGHSLAQQAADLLMAMATP